jgi:hypothetical protein
MCLFHQGLPESPQILVLNEYMLDEGNESSMGSQFSMSCHSAKLDTAFSFCNLNRMQSCHLIKMLTNIIIPQIFG